MKYTFKHYWNKAGQNKKVAKLLIRELLRETVGNYDYPDFFSYTVGLINCDFNQHDDQTNLYDLYEALAYQQIMDTNSRFYGWMRQKGKKPSSQDDRLVSKILYT